MSKTKRKPTKKQLAALARGRAKRKKMLGLADMSDVSSTMKSGARSIKSPKALKTIGRMAVGAFAGNLASKIVGGVLVPKVSDSVVINKSAGHLASALVAVSTIGYGKDDVGYGAAAATMTNIASDVLNAALPNS